MEKGGEGGEKGMGKGEGEGEWREKEKWEGEGEGEREEDFSSSPFDRLLMMDSDDEKQTQSIKLKEKGFTELSSSTNELLQASNLRELEEKDVETPPLDNINYNNNSNNSSNNYKENTLRDDNEETPRHPNFRRNRRIKAEQLGLVGGDPIKTFSIPPASAANQIQALWRGK
jgi:hypothetical protein